MLGKPSMTSVMRVKIASTTRPPVAARMPTTSPMVVAIAVTSSAAPSDVRAPAKARASWSRPAWSVPSQCAPLGPSSLFL